MTKLMDLEELLYDVKNKELIPILREAVACYHASSYRACIILSFNALVDDLLIKLKNIKDINADAKKIYNHVNKLIEEQSSFETPLIEQLVKAKIFTDLDGELYKTFQKFRHKSAHPSGYTPTAECARFIYTEILTVFLNKKALLTSDRIDELLTDIAEDYFFPSTNIKDRANVVKQEISNIHPDALPKLVNRVYLKAVETGEDAGNKFSSFIGCLLYLDVGHLNELIINQVIKKNISKAKHSFLFTSLISSNVSAFEHIDEITSKKLMINLKERLKNAPVNLGDYVFANPYYVYLKVSNEGKGILHQAIIDTLDIFLENPARLPLFLAKVDKSTSSTGRTAYLEIFRLMMNEMINGKAEKVSEILDNIISSDVECIKGASPQVLFEFCCAIVANKTNSKTARLITEDKFEQLAYIIEKSQPYYTEGYYENNKFYKSLSKDKKEKLSEIYAD